MNAACFSSSEMKRETRRRVLEKLALRKAGTGQEENLAREQVGQCSCSLVWCVCVMWRCTVLSIRAF